MTYAYTPTSGRKLLTQVGLVAVVGLIVALAQWIAPAPATAITTEAAQPPSLASASASEASAADTVEVQPFARRGERIDVVATDAATGTSLRDVPTVEAVSEATTVLPVEPGAQQRTDPPARLPAPLSICSDVHAVPATVDANGPTSTISSTGDYSSSYPAWHAFDNNASTLWLSEQWQQWRGPAVLTNQVTRGAEAVTAYEIGFANGPSLTTRAPKSWVLQGSNDAQTWSDVDTRSNETAWLGSETRQYHVELVTASRFYRLQILEDNDPRAPIVVASIAELTLYAGCTFMEHETAPVLHVHATALPGTATCPATYADAASPDSTLVVSQGDDVKFCFNILNSGDGTAQDASLSHPALPAAGAVAIGDLLPGGESATEAVVTNIDAVFSFVSVATVTATDPAGDAVSASQNIYVQVESVPDPELQLIAVPLPGGATCPQTFEVARQFDNTLTTAPGKDPVFCFNIRNIGDGDAFEVLLTHPALASGEQQLGTLAAGDEFAVTAQVLGIEATFATMSTATVTAINDLGQAQPVATSDVVLIWGVNNPHVELIANAVLHSSPCPATFDQASAAQTVPSLTLASSPADVHFCFNLRNEGLGHASEIVLQHPSLVGGEVVLGSLAAGAETSVGAIVFGLDQTFPLETTAVATAKNVVAEPQLPAHATVLLDYDVAAPLLQLALSIVREDENCPTEFDANLIGDAPTVTVPTGNAVKFCYNLWNSGDGIATNVELIHPALVGGQNVLADIAPDAEFQVTALVFGIDDTLGGTTVATTTATDVLGDQPVTATDSASLQLTPLVLACTETTPIAVDATQAFSSGNYSNEYPASHAFDGPTSTMWISRVWEDPAFVGLSLPAGPAMVTAYQIRFANGPSLVTRAPNTWSLEGTNDGTNWITVDKQQGQTGWASSETRSFNVGEPDTYSRYRIVFYQDNDDRAPIVVISIADLVLHQGCEF